MATPVQSASNQVTAASSIACTLNGVTTGNTLVMVVIYNDSTGIAGQVLSAPTGFTAAEHPASVSSGPTIGAAIFYQANVTGGNFTVTVNTAGSAGAFYASASLTEWAFTATPLDQVAGPGTSQGASSTGGGTPTTAALAQSNETVIAAISIGATTGLASAGISDPPSGYTSLKAAQNTSVENGGEIAYKDAGSTSGQSATWSWAADSSQTGSVQVIATFKQSGGGGSPTVHTLMMLGMGN